MIRHSVRAALTLLTLTCGITGGQSPAFEVASVRANRTPQPGGIVDLRPGRFDATNVTLREILSTAFDIERSRIGGRPDWMDSDRFDVQARADGTASREDTRAMLRSLLVERFQLRARVERREADVFALRKAREDRLGPRMLPAAAEACVADGAGAPTQFPTCGRLSAGPGRMAGRSVSMDTLAVMLAPRLGRAVVNRTGVEGLHDLVLEWAMDDAQRAALARSSPDGAAPPPPVADLPGLPTALTEQLGLRLQSEKGIVEVLVVDSVQRPSANS